MGDTKTRSYEFTAPKPVIPSLSNMAKSLGTAVVLALLSLLSLGLPELPPLSTPQWVTLATVTVVFIMSMMTMLHFEYRSRPLMISFGDLPLVVCLLLLPAWPVVIVRTLALLFVAILQRKSAHRTVFNFGFVIAETAVGYALIRLRGDAAITDPHTWFVTVGTIFALNVLSLAVIIVYASLLDGSWPSLDGVWVTFLTLIGAGLTCSVTGLLGSLSLAGTLWAAPFMVFSFFAVFGVFKARQEIAVQGKTLREFRKATAHNNCTEYDVMMALMKHASSMIHTNHAKVTVYPEGTSQRSHLRVHSNWFLRPSSTADTDSLIAVLSREDGTQAVLELQQKRAELGRLTNRDLDATAVIVGHAESTWRSTFLVDKMRYEAQHDSITAIGNRNYLIEKLAAAPTPGTLAMVSCLTMPKIVTAFGVAIADDLMVFIAQRLANCATRAPALRVARTGDEAFGIWLPTGHEAALADIQTALSRPLKHGSTTISMTYAYGFTETTPETAPQVAIHQAHTAMVAAAQTKSDVPVGFDGSYVAKTRNRLALSEDLRAALATGGITVSYQPKVCARTRRVIGCEALARWAHPRHGVIPPFEFVHIAEQTDQIQVLTQHMLRVATRACQSWQSVAPGVGVSVNASAVDLADLGFVDLVDEVLADAQLASDMLTIEVTETDMMDDTVTVIATLSRLQSRGVRISVDDFGTGYSSLAYIRNLPIDEAKIDKSFIMSLESDPTGQVLVSNIVSLVHSLGITVVAEGVESAVIGDHLASVSCDVLQGYGISWPLNGDSFLEWLEKAAAKPSDIVRLRQPAETERTIVLPPDAPQSVINVSAPNSEQSLR